MSSPDDITNFCPCCVELTRTNEALRAEAQALRKIVDMADSCFVMSDRGNVQALVTQTEEFGRMLLNRRGGEELKEQVDD